MAIKNILKAVSKVDSLLKLQDVHTVNTACAKAGISKSSYYRYKALQKKPSPHDITNLVTKLAMKQFVDSAYSRPEAKIQVLQEELTQQIIITIPK